jgi:ketosteroid isomerase-like protein
MLVRNLEPTLSKEHYGEYVVAWNEHSDFFAREAVDALRELMRREGLFSASDEAASKVFRLTDNALDDLTLDQRQDYFYGDPVEIPDECLIETSGTLTIFATADGKVARFEFFHDSLVVCEPHTLNLLEP